MSLSCVFSFFLSHCDFSLICAFRFFLSVTLRCAAIFLPLAITTQLAETVEKCLFCGLLKPAWVFYSSQLARRGKNSVSTAHTTCRNAQMRKLVPGTDRINAMLKAPMTCLKFSGRIISQLYWFLVISQIGEDADMIFVQNFTLPTNLHVKSLCVHSQLNSADASKSTIWAFFGYNMLISRNLKKKTQKIWIEIRMYVLIVPKNV